MYASFTMLVIPSTVLILLQLMLAEPVINPNFDGLTSVFNQILASSTRVIVFWQKNPPSPRR
jgi:hypothetical protein